MIESWKQLNLKIQKENYIFRCLIIDYYAETA